MWLSYFEFLKKLLQSEPGSDCSILSCSNLNICFGTIVTGFSFNRICVFLRNISLTFYLEIRTRFRFKIIIRYYSFSLIQFSISFSKNQYLHNWNRVLIAVFCLALTWMYVLMWSEPCSDLSKYHNINLIIQIKSNKPSWYTWFIVGSQIIIFHFLYRNRVNMSESEDIKGNESSKYFLADTYVTAIFNRNRVPIWHFFRVKTFQNWNLYNRSCQSYWILKMYVS